MKQMNPFTRILGLKQAANKMMTSVTNDKLLAAEFKMSSPDSTASMAPMLVFNENEIPLMETGDYQGSPDDEGITIDVPEGKVVVVEPEDSPTKTACQILPAFLLAGMGMVGAGLILDLVQRWEVFVSVPELFILVPPLLGLKGNLEMTLASRLSTQANLGTLNRVSEKMKCIIGNLVLTQCQAIVVGCAAAVFAIIFGALTDNRFHMESAILVVASSVTTASLASFILGSVTIAVVLISDHFGIDPDNIATPLAASLGDVSTLALLAGTSSLLYGIIDHMAYVGTLIILIFISLTPLWAALAYRNRYTQDTLKTGWVPILMAMAIALVGGFVLDFAITDFTHIAMFQPVVNGLGGNVAAIQASRISTYLHKHTTPGILPSNHMKACVNPLQTFTSSGNNEPHSSTAKVLMLLVVPAHLAFMFIIVAVSEHAVINSVLFVGFYLAAVILQVALLLYLTLVIVHAIWGRGGDPDNAAIPYLTAIGDLLGITFLFIAFLILQAMGVHHFF